MRAPTSRRASVVPPSQAQAVGVRDDSCCFFCVDHRRRGKLCLHFFLIGASIEVPSASRLSISARFHRKRMQAYQPA